MKELLFNPSFPLAPWICTHPSYESCTWCADAEKHPADVLEEAKQHANEDAFANTNKAEEAPIPPDHHATEEVSHADEQEHHPSGTDSLDTVTSYLQSSAEAGPADPSLDVLQAAPPADDGSVAGAPPSELMLGRDPRPDAAEEDAQQQPGLP